MSVFAFGNIGTNARCASADLGGNYVFMSCA